MMRTSLNEGVINTLFEQNKKKTLLVSEISTILDMDKVSVYRRLKGDVKFTVDEIGILAKYYGISLDNLLNMPGIPAYKSMKMAFSLALTPDQVDYDAIKNDLLFIKNFAELPNSEAGGAFYSFPIFIFTSSVEMLRFFWFLWEHYYFEDKNHLHTFESVVLPDEFIEYNIEGSEIYKNFKYVFQIWDEKIFDNLVNNILYFKDIQLITADSVKAIKRELNSLIDTIERYSVNGKITETRNKFELYCSTLNIDKTAMYMWSEDMWMYSFPVFEVHRAYSYEKVPCAIARDWIRGIRTASVLISESAEKERVVFFTKQREAIDRL